MIRQGEYEGREGEMAPYTIRLVPIGEPPLSHYSPMLGQWVNLDTPVEWELNPTGAGEGQPLKYDIMLSSPANQSLFRGQFKANMTINIAEKI